MVIRPPDYIFKQILAGKLVLDPKVFVPRKTSRGVLPPEFPPGRTAKLRAKLLKVGVDPVKVGLPAIPPPDTRIFIPPAITYSDACREIKFAL
jgi:hypothetical protein